MTTILDGIRVLDFGRWIAGPYCAHLLAHLGADVIRVERPKGEDDRFLMPVTEHGEGAQYLQCNGGKRSLTLEMTSPEGRAVIRRLVEQADVVIANYSPGALKHFGLDYETLRAIKDDIILTTASAYSTESPYADRIGFDGVGQAVSGAIWLTGEGDNHYRSATAPIDFSTSLSCAYGTLAAIINKMKTGKGTHVQASLVGTSLNITNQILMEEASGANHRVPTGNRSPMSGPSDVFRARDGMFIMQVIGQKVFQRWAKMVGRPDLITNPLYATDILRGKNGEELSRIMQDWSAKLTREDCMRLLAENSIGSGPVLTPAEVIGGEMDLVRTFMPTVPFPGSEGLPIARPPAHLSNGTRDQMSRPPLLGEHTAAVLQDYGFNAEEIARLRAGGTV